MFEQRVYLYITPFFPSLGNWRGAYCYDFVRTLVRHLELSVGVGSSCAKAPEDKGWKVVVFKEGDGSDYELEVEKKNGGGDRKIIVHTFKARRLPSNIFPNLFARWNQRSFIRKVKEALTPLFDSSSQLQLLDAVEVCHCNTANYGIYALAMKKANPRCKTLLHHHDLASFGLNMGVLRHCWIYNMIQFPILRRMHEKIDCHVFISEASRRSFLAAPDASWTMYEDYKKQMRGLPYRPARIKGSVILHNGVDKDVFKVERVGGGGQRTDNSFIIGCVGNFQELKGQETLIRAVGLMVGVARGGTSSTGSRPRIKLRLVGSGARLDSCRRLAQELNAEAEFLREVSHEKLADFYRGLDLFVLPSWFEGFGCVYTEAHSCGVPFIACEGQGIEDILEVEERSPWLCRPGDAEDLAAKIEKAINSIAHLHFDTSHSQALQPLNEDQDIDALVGKFVKEIGL